MSDFKDLFSNAVTAIKTLYDHPEFETSSQEVLNSLDDLESLAEEVLTSKHYTLSDMLNGVFDIITNHEKENASKDANE